MTEKTTVVIMSHNYEAFLEKSLSSVLNQTRRPAHIVIIDDASDTIAKPWVERYLSDDIEFHRVEFRNHQKTRNFGLSRANSDYVLFLDADDYMAVDMIERLEDALDAYPEARLAYCDKTVFGDPQAMSRLHLDETWHAGPFSLERLRFKNFIMATSLIRRSAIVHFEERILRLADWDTWLGILDEDTHAVYVPAPLLHYRVHGRNVSIRQREMIERLKILTRHGLITLGFAANPVRCSHPIIITMDSSPAPLHDWQALAQTLRTPLRVIVGTVPDATGPLSEQVRHLGRLTLQSAPADDLESLIRRYAGVITSSPHDLVAIVGNGTPSDWLLSAFAATDPSMRSERSIDEVLACRSLEELGHFALSPNAIRLLLYLPPSSRDSPIQRYTRAAREFYVRNVGWRFAGRKAVTRSTQP